MPDPPDPPDSSEQGDLPGRIEPPERRAVDPPPVPRSGRGIPRAAESEPAPARPGRPRSERARRAVLEAAGALLERDGLPAMTMEAIARRSGVSKATIYRWWPSKEAVTLDALAERLAVRLPAAPGRHSLRSELVLRLRSRAAVLRAHPAILQTLAAVQSRMAADPGLGAAYHDHVSERLHGESRAAFGRARRAGQVRADADLDVALDLLFGGLYLRLLEGLEPCGDDFAERAVDIVLRGVLSSPD